MSKQIQILAFCDGDHEQDTPATVERTLSLDGKPWVNDLCERCDRQFIWPLLSLSEAGAEPPDPPPRPSRSRKGIGGAKPRNLPTVCPDCGYECPTRSALGQHVKAKHGKVLADYDWDSE